MLTQAVIGVVRALNGILEKVNAHGEAHIVKSGAPLHQGDILTLLSGEAYIQFIEGFPEALALNKPFPLDGISPVLKFGSLNANEEIIKEALAKGIDPSLVLDILGATAAGVDVLGSGSESYYLDPIYSAGLVFSGYSNLPLALDNYKSELDPQGIVFRPILETITADSFVIPDIVIPPSVINGIFIGDVTEPGGLNNSIPGAPKFTAQITSIDGFVPDGKTGPLGTFTMDASGKWTYELHDNSPFVDALKAGEVRVVTFDAVATDGTTQKITVTIHGTNDAPNALPENSTVLEDTTLTGNLLINDSDPEGDPITITTFSIEGDTTVYQAGQTVTINGKGELVIKANGDFSFTPSPDYNGPIPTTTYKMSDGTMENSTTLSLTIRSVNDAPDGTDENITTTEDTPVVIKTTDFGFTDPKDNPADSLQAVKINTLPLEGTLILHGAAVTAGQIISVADINGGSLVYIPATNMNGAINFTFQVQDSGGTLNGGVDLDPTPNTLTINVTPVNDAPINTIPVTQNVNEDLTLVFNTANGNAISLTDIDSASVTTTISVAHGSLMALATAGVTITNNGTGTVTLVGSPANITTALNGLSYTPVADYNGADSLTIVTSDGALSDTDSIAITVNPVVDIANDAITLNEDTVTTYDVNNNDTFENAGHTITAIDGTAIAVGGTVAVANGTVLLNTNGTLSFTPTANYNGSTSFTYTVTSGGVTETATVNLTVNPVNDAPINSVPGAQTTNEDTAQVFSSANGNAISLTDIDSASVTTTISVAHGSLTALATAGVTITNNGTGSVTLTGSPAAITTALDGLSYTPVADYNGADSLTVVTSDGALSDTDNIAITVNPVVDIANDAITVNEDTVATYDVNNNDTFENAGHTITAINGTAIAVGGTVAVANGTVLLNADGTLSFTPAANYNGSTSFTYTVTSGGVTETATVNLTVNPVNDAPTNSVPGAQTTNEDTAQVFSSANGNAISLTDIDSASVTTTISVAHGSLTALATAGVTITNNGTGTVTLVGTPANITTALDGLSYTPVADYNGSDSLTVVTSDGALNDTDSIAITVTPVVDIANDAITLNEDTVATYDVNNNDTFENAGHTITAINSTAIAVGGTVGVANGTVLLNANGTLSFTPTANYNGSTSFTYTVTSGGVTETATVNVTVNPVNDAPTNSVPGAQTTNEDTAQVFSSANGNAISLTDIDSASVTTTISVAHGSLTALATAGVMISNNGTDSVTLTGSPAAITTALDGLSYTPVADYNGADSLTIVTSDGALSDTDSIAITVNPVVDIANDAATFNEDTVANLDVNANDTFENAGHTITAINGTAVDEGSTVVVANGTVLLNGDGTLSFTPTANYNGSTSFTYTVTSGGVTETATVNLTVNPVNDAPTNSVPGAQSTNEDTAQVFSSANGNAISLTDIDSASVTTTISVAHGSLTALATAGVTITNNGTGSVTLTGSPAAITTALDGLSYIPVADYNGADSLTVVTSDGTLSDTDNIAITVNPVVDIANDAITLNEDTVATYDVNNNDTFENAGHTITAIDGTAITAGNTVTVANGTVLLNNDGTLSFTPTANYNGSTSFTYTVTSGGVTETATVNVTVNPVNDAPTNSVPGAQTTNEDTAQVFSSANGNAISLTDIDSASVTTTISVAHGSLTALATAGVTITNNGTGTVTLVGSPANITTALNGLTYIPVADYNGSDSLTIVTSDGALSDTDNLAITVNPVVDIANDAIIMNEDTVANYDVNNNDTFENAGHTITAINGTAIAYGGTVAVANGTVLLNADGTLSFTPAVNYNGSTSFTYTVTSGGFTETATVNLTVNPVNDAPTNSVPGAQSTNEDTARVFSSANGNAISLTDIDSASVTTTISVAHGSLTALATAGVTITNNGTGTVTLVGSPANITTALNGLSYTPVADYNGADSLTVVTSDGALSDTDNIAITVNPVVDIANDAITLNEDTVATYDVNNNDTFENAGHTITAINGTAIAVGGTVAVANGTVLLNANGTLSFTPAANYNGSTSFTYTVTSGGVTETATVNLTVNPVNDAPTNSVPGAQTTNEDTAQVFSSANGNAISLTDIDSASVTTTISVAHGSLTALATAGVTITNNGTGTVTLVGSPANITIALNGLSYTPVADYNGADSLTVVTSDGALSDTDNIAITVNPVVDIANDAITLNEDTVANYDVNNNDTFENAGHTITAINGTSIAVGGTVGVANGTVLLNANGTLSFTPIANYNGSTSFTYTVTSGGVTETATVNLTVNPVNDAPINSFPGAQTTNEDTAQVFSSANGNAISLTDIDSASVTTTVSVNHGTLTLSAAAVDAAAAAGVTISNNGTGNLTLVGAPNNINTVLNGLSYHPIADYNGADNLTIVTSDGALSDTDSIAITVNPVVDIANDAITLNEDTVATYDVNNNDTFENAGHTITAINGTAIAVGGTVAVANGTVLLNANGTLSFTPTANYNGSTSFTYTVTSGGVTETATVNLTVNPVNDAPTNSVPGAQSTNEDTARVFSSANGNAISLTDIDSASVTTTISVAHGSLTALATAGVTITNNGTGTVTLVGSPANITTALNGLSYTPVADYNGADSLTVITSDGTLSDTDNIAITVNPVVDIANDAITLNEDTVANYDVNNNDTFENAGHTITAINGTAIAVGGTVGVANGTVLLNANGTLSFTPTANYNGSTSFTYTVTSGGVTETATVNVTVNPVNDAPINSVPGAQTTNEDTVRVFSSANGNAISLTDIDSASVTTTISVAHGSLTALATAGVTITNNGTGTVTLVGSPTNITTALNGLSYTPVADYNGADSLTIVTSDGALSDTDNIAITVNPVVDIANDAITLNEDTVANYDVNNNDTFENAGHTITAINGTAIAVGGTVAVANGTVLLNANGTLSFTPAANYNGSTSFTYTVTSGGVTETATVNVTVNPVNDAPINSVPGAQTTNEDTAQVFSSANGNAISLTDIDSASVTTTISVAHGSLTALATAGVTITNNGTGTVTLVGSPTNITTALNGLSYTPVADYNGADSLTVVTSDGTLSDTDNIAITVTPVVDIANDAITLNEDTVANYDVNNNDTFENAGHTITAINGTAIAVGGIVAVANGTVLLNANGTLSFTPTANYNGATSFTYTVTSGGVTETATVNVTVNPVNDAPINSVPGAQTMNEDATRIFSSANGNAISLTDIDSASVTTTISVAHGSLTALATAGVTITNNGTGTVTLVGSPANITIALNGLSYTPIADYNGPDSLTVVTNDGALSDTDSIVITVMPVADIVNDAVTTNEDTAVTINVNANDSFENAGHTITAINGTAIAVGGTVAVANGTVLLNANGTLSFTPTANYNGSTSFNYTVTSGGVTETATVNVTVNSVNDSPVNTISAQSTTEDTAVKLTGLSIVDVDAFGSTVSVTLAVASGVLTAATAGGVTVSGSGTSSVVLSGTVDNINAFLAGSSGVTYIPVANFSGSVNLTMTTNDLGNTGSGGALSDVDTVAINLTAVADAPMLSLPLTISTVNPGNTSISTEPGIVQTNLESELSLASGSLDTFNPPAGVTLNHSGNVNVFDGKLTNANYSLANGGQVSFGWQFVNGENIASEINSGYNDMAILVVTKPDGTKEMIQVTSSEQAGVSATVNGTYTYTATQAGNYQFSWLVTNGIDNNKDSQLNITSTTISYNSTAYGKPIAIPINAALKDPDGSETLTVRISGVPAGGVLSAGTLIAGVWEFTNMADLVGLIYYPPTSFTSGSINLTVTATATESSNGSTASTSQVLTISTDVTTNTISTGTEAGTVISGASGSVNDLIHAYAGNDTVNAGGGNDLVYGGAGNDTLNGEAGNDTIYGGIGNDIISGGDGNDLLFGQAGDDTLTGNAGNDILYGGTGIDNLNGGLGNDYMIGGQGADTLTGGGGIDTFVWLAGDNLGGTVASPIQDVITDFKPNPVGGGSPDVSVLNLSDLLLGENTANLDSYLNISKSGADTLIKIDPTGTNPVTNATQTIVLQGVDLTSVYGTINSHDIISNLITNGNLITD